MAYISIIIVVLFVLVFLTVLLLFIPGGNAKPTSRFSSVTVPKDTPVSMPAVGTTPNQTPPAEQIRQQRFVDNAKYAGLTDGGATRTPGRTSWHGANTKGITHPEQRARLSRHSWICTFPAGTWRAFLTRSTCSAQTSSCPKEV